MHTQMGACIAPPPTNSVLVVQGYGGQAGPCNTTQLLILKLIWPPLQSKQMACRPLLAWEALEDPPPGWKLLLASWQS